MHGLNKCKMQHRKHHNAVAYNIHDALDLIGHNLLVTFLFIAFILNNLFLPELVTVTLEDTSGNSDNTSSLHSQPLFSSPEGNYI